MSKFEALILGILFGAVPILLCLLLVVVIGLSADWTDDKFGPYAIVALGAGLVIDITFLKRWVTGAYNFSLKRLTIQIKRPGRRRPFAIGRQPCQCLQFGGFGPVFDVSKCD